MKRIYTIKTVYSDTSDNNHQIVESWTCETHSQIKHILVEALDLVKDKKGNPIKPKIANVKAALGKYIDDNAFINQEFERQTNAYNIYKKLITKKSTIENIADNMTIEILIDYKKEK